MVNDLGSGILENPALLPFLPELCERLLGQQLRLPSVETWWCGDPRSLGHVLANLDSIVVRPISRGHGRSVWGAALTAAQREQLVAGSGRARTGSSARRCCTCPPPRPATTDRLVRRSLVLRSFAVRSGGSYTAMLGGLARVTDDEAGRRGPLVTDPDGGLAKDVWVVGRDPVVAARIVAPRGAHGRRGGARRSVGSTSAAMVPRVLSDLFWFGRYAERAEDLLRLVLATRTVAIETDCRHDPGRTLEVLLQAVTHVSTTYPGFLEPGVAIMPEFRSLLLDRHRTGTRGPVARRPVAGRPGRPRPAVGGRLDGARRHRAGAGRPRRPTRYDQGLQLTDASERVLSGLLALGGIVSENMVRDPGWYMLDSGRGLERALQVVCAAQGHPVPGPVRRRPSGW